MIPSDFCVVQEGPVTLKQRGSGEKSCLGRVVPMRQWSWPHGMEDGMPLGIRHRSWQWPWARVSSRWFWSVSWMVAKGSSGPQDALLGWGWQAGCGSRGRKGHSIEATAVNTSSIHPHPFFIISSLPPSLTYHVPCQWGFGWALLLVPWVLPVMFSEKLLVERCLHGHTTPPLTWEWRRSFWPHAWYPQCAWSFRGLPPHGSTIQVFADHWFRGSPPF